MAERKRFRALLIDDDEEFRESLALLVEREGFEVRAGASLAEARRLHEETPDVVLVDLHLPDGSGLDAAQRPRSCAPTEIVVITGQASVDTAVEALRRGASDYLVKPVDIARVKMVLANVAPHPRAEGGDRQPARRAAQARALRPLIGARRAMQKVYDLIARVAPTEATRADHGRERHRQGAGGRDDPRAEPPAQASRSCRSTAARSRRT